VIVNPENKRPRHRYRKENKSRRPPFPDQDRGNYRSDQNHQEDIDVLPGVHCDVEFGVCNGMRSGKDGMKDNYQDCKSSEIVASNIHSHFLEAFKRHSTKNKAQFQLYF